ncbi:MAG: arsenite methyltransferase [Gammaproteobacteria bacterium]|nr:MAG: arsenite methyltransferase [Gammaproteobacteria bacterium]
MSGSRSDDIRQSVREAYSAVAEASNESSGCGEASSCCGVSDDAQINAVISTRLGYSQDDRDSVPEGADMGLGCGNPRAIASLKNGEVVLDLGSGGGFDSFLAAQEVGEEGMVIGVDMTPSMVSKARANAEKGHYNNVQFRLGEIEHLPIGDATVDVIISNCVINLSPDKRQVFIDAHRVLKSGGRLAISDIVASAELPDDISNDVYLYSACVSGASTVDQLQHILSDAGFVDIRIQPKDESKDFIKDWAPATNIEDYVLSATIEALKPA